MPRAFWAMGGGGSSEYVILLTIFGGRHIHFKKNHSPYFHHIFNIFYLFVLISNLHRALIDAVIINVLWLHQKKCKTGKTLDNDFTIIAGRQGGKKRHTTRFVVPTRGARYTFGTLKKMMTTTHGAQES